RELDQQIRFCFSSRRRHTSFSRDWSSDVCSSDLHENDIELLLAVARLDLHRHGLAYEVAEHRQGLRFLLQEQVDHRLRGEDAELDRKSVVKGKRVEMGSGEIDIDKMKDVSDERVT